MSAESEVWQGQGARVKRVRWSLGLTQEAFSEIIGAHHRRIYQIERGTALLKTSHLYKLKGYARWLNINWLVTGEGGMSVDPEGPFYEP